MKTYLVRRLVLGILLAAAGLNAAVAPSDFTAKERAQGYREHVILARPREKFRATADADEQREGMRIRQKFSRMRDLRVLELSSSDSADAAIARLRATGRYDYVEPDRILYARVIPNDPSFYLQWSLRNTGLNGGTAGADIGAVSAWDLKSDASSVIVAVIDSGIRLTHTEFTGNLWSASNGTHGISATGGNGTITDTSPNDTNKVGHGTHVSGIIGARGNNANGIAGVAWQVKLMPLRFIHDPSSGTGSAGGTTSDSITCINFAITNKASIINASYGSSTYSQGEYDAINAARAASIIFVAAAGNDSLVVDNGNDYPAGYALDNIVAVAATTNTDTLASYSSFGSGSVDLAAPGGDATDAGGIYSTYNNDDNGYAPLSGTSMAAPHVSGALALLRAKYPNDTYRQTINRLLRNTTRLASLRGQVQTGGRLNLAAALASAPGENGPFNDAFAARAILAGSNARVRASNVGATNEGGEPGNVGSATLWWSWQATENTKAIFETAGSGYDTLLAVYTGNTLNGLSLVGANDDAPGLTTSSLTIDVTAGTTYQVVVGGKSGATGFTALHVGAIPGNDTFASAKIVSGSSVSDKGTLLNASRETGEPNPTGNAAGNSVWYKWTAPTTDRYFLSAFATEIDTVAAVYTGTTLSSLNVIASNDDSTSSNTDALVPFNAQAGTTYYFWIDHASRDGTSGGDFVMTLTPAAWEFPANDAITSSPAIGADGTIYFGAGSVDAFDTRVYAVTSSGARKWSVATGGNGVMDASPAVGADGTVYIGADNKVLYALDGASGSIKWSFSAGTAITSTPAISSSGTVYFRDDTKLYAFNGANGALIWSFPLTGSPAGTYSSPAIAADGTLYVGSDGGKLFAVTANGALKWTFTADGDIYTSPSIATDGTLYFATLNGTVYALTDATTGATKKWSWTTPANSSVTSSISLGADGTLYFAAYDHKLYALSSAGIQKWSYTLGDEVRAASPAVSANGTIYIPCYDGFIYAISSNGSLLTTYATAKQIRSSPAIGGGRLYVGSSDGKLYAFDIGQSAAASTWPMFHANAARTGRPTLPTITIGSQPQSVSLAPGARLTLSVSASGVGTLSYQWYKDGNAIGGATSASYTVSSVTLADNGVYTAVITDASGSVTSSPAVVSVIIPGGSRIVNLSARGRVGAGDSLLIAGFVLSGSPDKAILIRGIGPGLIPLGVPAASALPDPQIELHKSIGSSSTLVGSNNDWGNDPLISSTSAALGAFPLAASSKDAALVTAPLSNAYTVQVRDVNGASGVALAELYDTNISTGARLVNISARCGVGTGDDVLVAGFVISGNGPRRVLIRAVGPSLVPLGLSPASVLANPTIDLKRIVNGVASLIASNDDWIASTDMTNAFSATGAFSLLANSKDAALLLTLDPGVYTAQVSGVGSTTGIALVEVYEVP